LKFLCLFGGCEYPKLNIIPKFARLLYFYGAKEILSERMANTGYLKSVLLLSMVLIFVAPGHAAGRVVTQPETREKAVALFHD